MKKGVTFVELAVVLAVLGMLALAGFKVWDMFGDARTERDIAKITKLANSVESYYKKYSRYPGRRGDGIDITYSTDALYEDLVADGLVIADDFYMETDGTYLSVFGCTGYSTGEYELIEQYNMQNMCIVLVDIPPTTKQSSKVLMEHWVPSKAIACFLEAYIDDKDNTKGRVRSNKAQDYEKCSRNEPSVDFTYTVF